MLTAQDRLKCDRGQPCGLCASRGLSLSCTYVSSNLSRPSDRNQSCQVDSTSMQDRIGQLEQLVISLFGTLNTSKSGDDVPAVTSSWPKVSLPATSQTGDGKVLPQDTSQLSDDFGRISLENAEVKYVEGGHWTSILDGVCHFPFFPLYPQSPRS